MKKILLTLFVGLIGLINFGYCEYVEDLITYLGESQTISVNNYSYTTLFTINSNDWNGDTFCIEYESDNTFILGSNSATTENNYTIRSPQDGKYVCTVPYAGNINAINPWGSGPIHITYRVFKLNALLLTSIPILSSLQCQTEYNLIPISSVDQNYCVNNGFCPSGGGDCPVCPGSGDNWSALYINDIQHLGKPIINITFPDYLDWDYTTTENEFNLDIVGYPVDTEYIDGIIRTQNYKPTSEDFTQLVGMLAPYSKYLLFLLFIFIIWAWIKKPFKSKKL